MVTPKNHALLIGVSDYSAFDRSTGKPQGSSDLPGSVNDAAVFFRMLRQLGIPASNLRILTSPKLNYAELDGATEETVGEATEENIKAATSWLAEQLAQIPGASGFLAYSGHGDWLAEEGLVICPSDTEDTTLLHAIPLAHLQAPFIQRGVGKNLTILLDCCHSAARSPNAMRMTSSLTKRLLPEALANAYPFIQTRVLSACGPSETSYQARFSGAYRGAFSWAASTAVEQWQSKNVNGNIEIDISYSELISRIGLLLSALSFDQTPKLRAPDSAADFPIFHTGPLTREDGTSADPNKKRYGGQLDPDCLYNIYLDGYGGEVLSTGNTIGAAYSTMYNQNTEYWSLSSALLSAASEPPMGTALSLTKTQSSINWQNLGFPEPGALTAFGMPNTTVWTKMPSGHAPPNAFYNTAIMAGLVFDLQAPSSSASWRGTMTWYLALASTDAYWAGTGAGAGGTFTFGERPSISAGQSWYFVTISPLSWGTSSAIVSLSSLVIGVGSTCSSTSTNTSLKNKLWLAYTTTSNEVHLRSSTDGTSYTSGQDTGALADTGPALAITNGSSSALYVAYREHSSSSSHLHLRYTTDGTHFSDQIDTSYSSSHAPALAALGSTLYMAYQNASGDLKVVGTSSPQSSSSWQQANAHTVADSMTGGPAMVAWNNTLYVVARVSGKTINVYSSTDGANWSAGIPIYQDFRDPTITVMNNMLYIACRDGSNNVWICSSPDGSTFSGFTQLSNEISAVMTAYAPALSAIATSTSENLVLAYVATSTGSSNLRSLAAVMSFS